MRALALTTAAILIATTAMADVTCDLIFVSNPKLPCDCVELQAIPQNIAAQCPYCSIALRRAHYGRGVASSATTKCVWLGMPLVKTVTSA